MAEGGGLGGGELDVLGGGGGGAGEEAGEFGEVEVGGAALDGEGGHVVGPGGHVGRREGAQPDSGFFARLADLRHPFPPLPHPHPPKRRVFPVVFWGDITIASGSSSRSSSASTIA